MVCRRGVNIIWMLFLLLVSEILKKYTTNISLETLIYVDIRRRYKILPIYVTSAFIFHPSDFFKSYLTDIGLFQILNKYSLFFPCDDASRILLAAFFWDNVVVYYKS